MTVSLLSDRVILNLRVLDSIAILWPARVRTFFLGYHLAIVTPYSDPSLLSSSLTSRLETRAEGKMIIPPGVYRNAIYQACSPKDLHQVVFYLSRLYPKVSIYSQWSDITLGSLMSRLLGEGNGGT